MFQCPKCEKTYKINNNLEKHKTTHHLDVTLASADNTINNELNVEKTFMAQEGLNDNAVAFFGNISSQNQFTQNFCMPTPTSPPGFTEDIGLESNSVSMRLTMELEEQVESAQESIFLTGTPSTQVYETNLEPSRGQLHPETPTTPNHPSKRKPEYSTLLTQRGPLDFEAMMKDLKKKCITYELHSKGKPKV